MNKEWFIILEKGKQEGPFTLLELKRHPFVTPDTLVWKEGFADWIPLRDVAELEEIFKDEPESVPIEDLIKPKTTKPLEQDQEVLTLQKDPFQFFIWFAIILVVLIYVYLQINGNL